MKTILLIIATAGILFFAYRKVADSYYKKGWKAAHEKFASIEYGEAVGVAPLLNTPMGQNHAEGVSTLKKISNAK